MSDSINKWHRIYIYGITQSMLRMGIFFLAFIFTLSLNIFSSDTVVLIHGLGRTSDSMNKLEKTLQDTGFQTINISYPSRKHPIETLSDAYLGPVIESISPEVRIHIVTHSLGSIITRYYLSRHTLGNLGTVIMLGPPNHGSEIADHLENYWPFNQVLGPAFQQLTTDGASFVNQLPTPNYTGHVIAGTRSYNPLFSWIIPGKDDGKVAVQSAALPGFELHTFPVSHTWLMRNDAIISLIEQLLILKTQ